MSTPRAPRSRSSQVARAAHAGDSSRRIWIIATVVIVIGFAGIMAVALSQEQGSGSTDAREVGADVAIDGDTLPLHDAGAEPDAAVGLVAPELRGESLAGGTIEIANGGRPKVIGFFAHWCPHCQAEVPKVSEWVNAGNQPADVDLYAVSTDLRPNQGNYPPSQWFEGVEWAVPTLLDDSDGGARKAYGLSAYPYWVAVAADGTVVARASGEIGIEAFEELVEQARTGGS